MGHAEDNIRGQSPDNPHENPELFMQYAEGLYELMVEDVAAGDHTGDGPMLSKEDFLKIARAVTRLENAEDQRRVLMDGLANFGHLPTYRPEDSRKKDFEESDSDMSLQEYYDQMRGNSVAIDAEE